MNTKWLKRIGIAVAIIIGLSTIFITGIVTANVVQQNIPPTTKFPTTELESGATAQCKDGVYSYSTHKSGTCSGHGGVASRL